MIMSMTIPCPVCDAHDGHKDDCEQSAMEELREHNTNLPCPKCTKGKVGVNEDDFFECRTCHTQFASSGYADQQNPERMLLLDERHNRIIPVLVLERKGKGNLPIDQALEEISQRLAKKRRNLSRRQKR